MLFILGAVVFDVQPTNLHEVHATAGHAWAEKPLVGAAPNFEAMGPEPDIIQLKGRLIPKMFGAGTLDIMRQMARAPTPNLLIRGDGAVLGWMIIRSFHERHEYLDRTGLGRVIEFDIDLRSTPTGASAASIMSLLTGLF